MARNYFIPMYSEKLNAELLELNLWNCSGSQGNYTTTTVRIADAEDVFASNFFNGYGKPIYKNRDNTSAVEEFELEEEFINAIKNN